MSGHFVLPSWPASKNTAFKIPNKNRLPDSTLFLTRRHRHLSKPNNDCASSSPSKFDRAKLKLDWKEVAERRLNLTHLSVLNIQFNLADALTPTSLNELADAL